MHTNAVKLYVPEERKINVTSLLFTKVVLIKQEVSIILFLSASKIRLARKISEVIISGMSESPRSRQ